MAPWRSLRFLRTALEFSSSASRAGKGSACPKAVVPERLALGWNAAQWLDGALMAKRNPSKVLLLRQVRGGPSGPAVTF